MYRKDSLISEGKLLFDLQFEVFFFSYRMKRKKGLKVAMKRNFLLSYLKEF